MAVNSLSLTNELKPCSSHSIINHDKAKEQKLNSIVDVPHEGCSQVIELKRELEQAIKVILNKTTKEEECNSKFLPALDQVQKVELLKSLRIMFKTFPSVEAFDELSDYFPDMICQLLALVSYFNMNENVRKVWPDIKLDEPLPPKNLPEKTLRRFYDYLKYWLRQFYNSLDFINTFEMKNIEHLAMMSFMILNIFRAVGPGLPLSKLKFGNIWYKLKDLEVLADAVMRYDKLLELTQYAHWEERIENSDFLTKYARVSFRVQKRDEDLKNVQTKIRISDNKTNFLMDENQRLSDEFSVLSDKHKVLELNSNLKTNDEELLPDDNMAMEQEPEQAQANILKKNSLGQSLLIQSGEIPENVDILIDSNEEMEVGFQMDSSFERFNSQNQNISPENDDSTSTTIGSESLNLEDVDFKSEIDSTSKVQPVLTERTKSKRIRRIRSLSISDSI